MLIQFHAFFEKSPDVSLVYEPPSQTPPQLQISFMDAPIVKTHKLTTYHLLQKISINRKYLMLFRPIFSAWLKAIVIFLKSTKTDLVEISPSKL